MLLRLCARTLAKVETTMIIRTYSELITLPTFIDRYQYLRCGGTVGEDTFGFQRYLNQIFYKTREWRDTRRQVILRDLGCDLGVEGYEIYGRIIVHHMNPLTPEDILKRSEFLLDPEFLICTSHNTHQAITYGDESLLIQEPIVRTQFDTCPWRR